MANYFPTEQREMLTAVRYHLCDSNGVSYFCSNDSEAVEMEYARVKDNPSFFAHYGTEGWHIKCVMSYDVAETYKELT